MPRMLSGGYPILATDEAPIQIVLPGGRGAAIRRPDNGVLWESPAGKDRTPLRFKQTLLARGLDPTRAKCCEQRSGICLFGEGAVQFHKDHGRHTCLSCNVSA